MFALSEAEGLNVRSRPYMAILCDVHLQLTHVISSLHLSSFSIRTEWNYAKEYS